MTFVKDNKMWLIKDVSVILKSKGEFFWKGFIIGIGVTFLFHYSVKIVFKGKQNTCFYEAQ